MRKPRTISAFMQLILSSKRPHGQLNARTVQKVTETMYSNYESILSAIIHQDRGYYTKGQLSGAQEQHIEGQSHTAESQGCPIYQSHTETWNRLNNSGADRKA